MANWFISSSVKIYENEVCYWQLWVWILSQLVTKLEISLPSCWDSQSIYNPLWSMSCYACTAAITVAKNVFWLYVQSHPLSAISQILVVRGQRLRSPWPNINPVHVNMNMSGTLREDFFGGCTNVYLHSRINRFILITLNWDWFQHIYSQ